MLSRTDGQPLGGRVRGRYPLSETFWKKHTTGPNRSKSSSWKRDMYSVLVMNQVSLPLAIYDLTDVGSARFVRPAGAAQAVARGLPEPSFHFQGLEGPKSGRISGTRLRSFEHKAASFALLPGGLVNAWATTSQNSIPGALARRLGPTQSQSRGRASPAPGASTLSASANRLGNRAPCCTRSRLVLSRSLRGDHHTSRRLGSPNGRRSPGFRLPVPTSGSTPARQARAPCSAGGTSGPTAVPTRPTTGTCTAAPTRSDLVMNSNIYSLEICEGIQFRGGDAGLSITRGQGHFACWLPFASSYVLPR